MNDLKVVVIGGGSSYTPELVEGFINRYDELEITELHLVDIESGKEKLNTIFNLSKRMIEKANVGIKIFQTLDRQKALEDADFIMTQIRVGGLDARVLDERIPLSHGIIGQETNGAGGMFKALRTIPVILDIVEDVKKYAKKDA
ncbi:MAG: 6-phospho-beta-glucosidase, partial [Alkalibacterium gilvum]